MKSFLFIITLFLLLNTPAFSQDSEQVTSGIGYMSSFHKQEGIEFTIEFEGKVFREWTGLYGQIRTDYLDNYNSNYKGNNISTVRYDIAFGVHQYITPEFSIWRPHFGMGIFVSLQDFEEELSAISYRVSNEFSIGVEWELMTKWEIDSFSWGFGYKGTFHNFEFFGDNISSYENHITFVCSYNF